VWAYGLTLLELALLEYPYTKLRAEQEAQEARWIDVPTWKREIIEMPGKKLNQIQMAGLILDGPAPRVPPTNEKDGKAYSAAFANLVDACLQKKKRYRSPYTGGGAAAGAAAVTLFAWPASAAGPLDDEEEEERSIDPSLDPDYAPPRPLAEHPFIVEHDEAAFDLCEWMEEIRVPPRANCSRL